MTMASDPIGFCYTVLFRELMHTTHIRPSIPFLPHLPFAFETGLWSCSEYFEYRNRGIVEQYIEGGESFCFCLYIS